MVKVQIQGVRMLPDQVLRRRMVPDLNPLAIKGFHKNLSREGLDALPKPSRHHMACARSVSEPAFECLRGVWGGSPARRRSCAARIRFGRSEFCRCRFGSVAGTCAAIQCRSVRPQGPSKRNGHDFGDPEGMTLVLQECSSLRIPEIGEPGPESAESRQTWVKPPDLHGRTRLQPSRRNPDRPRRKGRRQDQVALRPIRPQQGVRSSGAANLGRTWTASRCFATVPCRCRNHPVSSEPVRKLLSGPDSGRSCKVSASERPLRKQSDRCGMGLFDPDVLSSHIADTRIGAAQ